VKLSILMPVFNERNTLERAVRQVLDVRFPCEVELVVVDDGSTDGTRDLYPGLTDERLRVVLQESNRGKGAAIRRAVEEAHGDYVVICDADLEYVPAELPSLLAPILSGEATVVFGTRSFGSHNSYSFWYVMGNRAVSLAANLLFNCYLSDLETCFKMMPRELYRGLDVHSPGFGMEAEVTAKLLRRGIRPFEVPITYRARSREQGKKLTWRDGVAALAILARIRFGPRR
jgi:glycosyltransferase involved in cell wall biosynthesis